MTPEERSGSRSRPGSFRLEYSHGYAVVTIYPPEGTGRPVYPDDIINRMKILKIPPVRLRDIEDIVEEASGKPVRLVKWPAGERLSAKVEILVDDDRMQAYAWLHPPQKGGGTLSEEDVVNALHDEGVVFGIDHNRIKKMLVQEEYQQSIPVAAGQAVKHGKGVRVEYTFNIDVGKPYLIMEFDRINYKELNLIQNKNKGDVLALLHPAEDPQDGKDVFGGGISAEPAPDSVHIGAGKNTAFNEDGSRIVAIEKGNVFLKGNAIHIEPVVRVKNVNYETGNIDFDGSVVISGTVADGFRVTATGSIEIGECAGKSEIRAEGNIVLKAGINGNQEGIIECDGDLYAKYIESATVTCRGNLFVEEAVMHSNCTVYGNMVMSGKRAEILAGSTVVGGSVWCKKLGGLYENLTRLSIGISPDTLKMYADLVHKVTQKKTELNTIDTTIKQMEQHGAIEAEPEELQNTYRKLKTAAEQLNREIGRLTHHVHEMRQELQPATDSYVVVQDRMYSGVTVGFGLEEYRAPEKGARKTVLRCVERKIIESGFNPSDPPPLKFKENTK